MNRDTDLTEVAAHVPPEAARLLMEMPDEVQESVLNAIREVVVNLEEADVDLDPVAYAAVIQQIALVAVAGHHEVFRLRTSMAQAATWLEGQISP